MKTLVLAIALLFGVFFMTIPKEVKADVPCTTYIMTCPDGTQHYVVICDDEDKRAWAFLLCGVGGDN
jgi:hypothetical protein